MHKRGRSRESYRQKAYGVRVPVKSGSTGRTDLMVRGRRSAGPLRHDFAGISASSAGKRASDRP